MSDTPMLEILARIIDPQSWAFHDDKLDRAAHWEANPATIKLVHAKSYREEADRAVAESLRRAAAVLQSLRDNITPEMIEAGYVEADRMGMVHPDLILTSMLTAALTHKGS